MAVVAVLSTDLAPVTPGMGGQLALHPLEQIGIDDGRMPTGVALALMGDLTQIDVNADLIFPRSAEVKFPNYAEVDAKEIWGFFGGRPRGF